MRRFMRRGFAAAILLIAGLAPSLAAAQETRLKAVATFSILADLVAQVGGNRVVVTSLVGPDADAHSYSPAPGDARRVAEADLVVVNGLGFEGWLERLIKASGTKAPVEHFTRAASKEFGARGISVTAVGPGPMDTPFFYPAEGADAVAYHKTAAALSPFSRTGLTDIEDVVPFIRHLVSEGWWITGQTILINGGYTTK